MKNEYKLFILNSLFGLMEGSISALEKMMIEDFPIHFPNREFDITVHSPKDNFKKYIVTTIIDNEKFTVYRDWGVEEQVDSLHPNHKKDLWFYEGDECHSAKTYSMLKNKYNL